MPSRASSLAKALCERAGAPRSTRSPATTRTPSRRPRARAARPCAGRAAMLPPAPAPLARAPRGPPRASTCPCRSASRADRTRPAEHHLQRERASGEAWQPLRPARAGNEPEARPPAGRSARPPRRSRCRTSSASSQPPPRHQPCTAAITGSCERAQALPAPAALAPEHLGGVQLAHRRRRRRRPRTRARPRTARRSGRSSDPSTASSSVQSARAPRPRARSAPRAGSDAAGRRLRDARSGRIRVICLEGWSAIAIPQLRWEHMRRMLVTSIALVATAAGSRPCPPRPARRRP